MRTSEVAERAGVNAQTLRYYERRGLVVAGFRRHSGQREYDASDVNRVKVIKAAQRLGFTLDEVAELLETGHHHGQDNGFAARAQIKLLEVEQRITDLQAIRSTLAAAIAVGCDDLDVCAETAECPLPFAELAD